MFKDSITASVVFVSITLMFSSCNGHNDPDPNPTNGRTSAIFNSEITYGTMTDREGNVYRTVTIGTQTWMAENLRTKTYDDGTPIPLVTDDTEWSALTDGAYCIYNNTEDIDTLATYGCLYNWYAVSTGKLAPEGWHVPTEDEWKTLELYLAGAETAGGKLKETSSMHWTGPNAGATNETGFTALPGGFRIFDGSFYYMGTHGYWWSISQVYHDPDFVWSRRILEPYSALISYNGQILEGMSVRCVKD
ncbi:MAG TPA: fibrobacter succinogenes major paralogous domain-containing protein [Bacteroidales bacterium]|nr:fibrobacter succinogenes major paralogous domain-containing protein [Bacteroidales bacterium]